MLFRSKWNFDTQEQIKLTLMEQADGMYVFYQHLNVRRIKCNFRFHWAALQLDDLKKCQTKAEIKRQLAHLPHGLDDIYNRILLGIKEEDQGYAKRFLQWLSFAVRPLTLKELATTAAVDLSNENGPEFKADNQLEDSNDILKICSSFVMKSEGMV